MFPIATAVVDNDVAAALEIGKHATDTKTFSTGRDIAGATVAEAIGVGSLGKPPATVEGENDERQRGQRAK